MMKMAYPDTLVHAKPLSDFVLIARAHSPRFAQLEEAGDRVIVHSTSAVPRQDLFKVNDAWSRSRHRHDRQSSKNARGQMLSVALRSQCDLYTRTATHRSHALSHS
jgi:hypothetical protein